MALQEVYDDISSRGTLLETKMIIGSDHKREETWDIDIYVTMANKKGDRIVGEGHVTRADVRLSHAEVTSLLFRKPELLCFNIRDDHNFSYHWNTSVKSAHKGVDDT